MKKIILGVMLALCTTSIMAANCSRNIGKACVTTKISTNKNFVPPTTLANAIKTDVAATDTTTTATQLPAYQQILNEFQKLSAADIQLGNASRSGADAATIKKLSDDVNVLIAQFHELEQSLNMTITQARQIQANQSSGSNGGVN